MAIMPHTADIVVNDIGRALAFYRALGLDIPSERDGDGQVEVATPGAMTLGFLTEAMVESSGGGWTQPVGQRVTIAFRCDDAAELDATYARITAAGHAGVKPPWNAFCGQRYASLADPDGNRVDLFAALPGA